MWSEPTLQFGIINSYTVYCNKSASEVYPEQEIGPDEPSVRSIVNGTTFTTEISFGHNPFTQYNCYVTANNTFGEGESSLIASQRTVESSKQLCVSIYFISILGKETSVKTN